MALPPLLLLLLASGMRLVALCMAATCGDGPMQPPPGGVADSCPSETAELGTKSMSMIQTSSSRRSTATSDSFAGSNKSYAINTWNHGCCQDLPLKQYADVSVTSSQQCRDACSASSHNCFSSQHIWSSTAGHTCRLHFDDTFRGKKCFDVVCPNTAAISYKQFKGNQYCRGGTWDVNRKMLPGKENIKECAKAVAADAACSDTFHFGAVTSGGHSPMEFCVCVMVGSTCTATESPSGFDASICHIVPNVADWETAGTSTASGYVGCFKQTTHSRRSNDAAISVVGFEDCKAHCKAFTYAGFECPRNGVVHCQCTNILGYLTSDDYCEGTKAGHNNHHCLGPYMVSGFRFGTANVGAYYRTE